MATAKKASTGKTNQGKAKPKASKTKPKSSVPAKKTRSASRSAPKAEVGIRGKAGSTKKAVSGRESQVAINDASFRPVEATEPSAEFALHEAGQEGEASFRSESAGDSTLTSTRRPSYPQNSTGSNQDFGATSDAARPVEKSSNDTEPQRGELPWPENDDNKRFDGVKKFRANLNSTDDYTADADPGRVLSGPNSKNRKKTSPPAPNDTQEKSSSETIERAGESARAIDATAHNPRSSHASADSELEGARTDGQATLEPMGSRRPSASQEGETALSAKEAIKAAREAINSARVALSSAKDTIAAATSKVDQEEKKGLFQELTGTLRNLVRSAKGHD